MKVFISWSGNRSKATAELLHYWVKCVVQASQPWISSRGIDRGALWFSEINSELKDTTVGIICLTQENKNAPWILFEAGALAKGLPSSRVCTYLVDLQPADLKDPLAQFNHTFPTKESVWNLVITLNNGLDSGRLDMVILERVFETYWPQFESEFAQILKSHPETTVVAPREERDLLAEILESTRGLERRLRNLEGEKYTISHVFPRKIAPKDKLNWTSFSYCDTLNFKSPNIDLIGMAVASLERGLSVDGVRDLLVKLLGVGDGNAEEIIKSALISLGAKDGGEKKSE